MKFLTIFFAILFICFNNYGQLTKGNWLVGGSGNFEKYKNTVSSPSVNEAADFTEISLSSSVGYFVFDKTAFGLIPSFTSIKGKITSTGGLYTDVQRYWFGPFARYYFLTKEKQFNILTDVSYQFGFNGGSAVGKGDLRTFSALAGPVIYFNTTVGLEFLMGYHYRKQEDKAISRINLNKGFHMVVGLQIHLQK